MDTLGEYYFCAVCVVDADNYVSTYVYSYSIILSISVRDNPCMLGVNIIRMEACFNL
jgi:hypothetical protein